MLWWATSQVLIYLVLAWKTYQNCFNPRDNSVWGARDIQRFYAQKLQLTDDDVRVLDWCVAREFSSGSPRPANLLFV